MILLGEYIFIFLSPAGNKCIILTGPGQYNGFFRILSELVFGLRYTTTKNMSSDRFASIEYNMTNSSWHFGPNTFEHYDIMAVTIYTTE